MTKMTKSCIEDNHETAANTPWQKVILLVSFPLVVGGLIIFLILVLRLVDLESYYWALIMATSYGVWMTIKWVAMRNRFLNARASVWFREDQLTRERQQQTELKELYYVLLGKKSPLYKKERSSDDNDEDDEENSMLNIENEPPYTG